jgi:hypothetical protein
VAQEGPDGTLTFPPPEEEAVETMAVPLRWVSGRGGQTVVTSLATWPWSENC